MQTLIALMIVMLAALYAGWKFLPKHLRGSLAAKTAAWALRSGKMSEDNVRRLESKLASGGACGSCDTCKACGTTANVSAVASFAPKEKRDAFMGIPIVQIKI